MSTCISRDGEYGQHLHEVGRFTCDRCLSLDVDALFAALKTAESERDALLDQDAPGPEWDSVAGAARILQRGVPEGPAAIHFCPFPGCGDLWESEPTCAHAVPFEQAATALLARFGLDGGEGS